MKARMGFVSNSSTSSFCIYGFSGGTGVDFDALKRIKAYDPDLFADLITEQQSYLIRRESENDNVNSLPEVIEALKNIDDPKYFEPKSIRGCDHSFVGNFCPTCGAAEWKTEDVIDEETVMEYVCDDIYMFVERFGLEYYSDGYNGSVGCSWSAVGDDETGSEFKQRVEKLIEMLFGKVTCETIEESYPS